MATKIILEELKAKQSEHGISLRKLALELEVSQPYLTMLFSGKRRLTRKATKKIEQYLKPKPSTSFTVALDNFIRSSSHKSPRTIETLQERKQACWYSCGIGANSGLPIEP